MLTDLIGGQVDFATAALPSVQAAPEERRAACHRHGHRSSACRQRPTFPPSSSKAFPVTWSRPGSPSSAPKGLPPADLCSASTPRVVKALCNDPEVKDAMARQGNVINIGAGRQAAMPFFRSELAQATRRMVKKAGVVAQ
jgi:tripartite-type tricarboxylate transporter receptor subunit TctC